MSARVTIRLEELLLLKAEARGFSFGPRQPVSSLLAGRHASRLRGRGLAFEELRHYHQGDDIRTMDWKATARLRSPYVRVYSEERERPVLLVVDQRRPMFFGSQQAMKSVTAAEVAALGAWRTLDSGDRVGGLVFNEQEIVEVRPHRSQPRVLTLFHAICRLNTQLASNEPPEGKATLNQALEGALRVAKHDHLVVLITDLDGANDNTQRLATRLSAHNDVLVVAVYDPLGISLTGTPGMFANDIGRTWEIPSHSAFSRDFQAAFQRCLDRWREIFRALRVPVLPISTARPVVEQIRALFGNRPNTL
ncbi:DUF58 domain-containing protein [Thalassoroseus pseudoceratinae]|uniref:DUF58 domain-containing protein n=1 Tax=Thalassoroseus pseudoceratinae TaxID=2713176 RepID=UPI00141F6CFA|nr:DUF58 domain-containing protein [Thalassoroseus pseudoceratinae]